MELDGEMSLSMVTKIITARSNAVERFLGVRYLTVSARSRHIQENAFLLQVKDHQEWDRAKLAAV
jgi:hypothetical protein